MGCGRCENIDGKNEFAIVSLGRLVLRKQCTKMRAVSFVSVDGEVVFSRGAAVAASALVRFALHCSVRFGV